MNIGVKNSDQLFIFDRAFSLELNLSPGLVSPQPPVEYRNCFVLFSAGKALNQVGNSSFLFWVRFAEKIGLLHIQLASLTRSQKPAQYHTKITPRQGLLPCQLPFVKFLYQEFLDNGQHGFGWTQGGRFSTPHHYTTAVSWFEPHSRGSIRLLTARMTSRSSGQSLCIHRRNKSRIRNSRKQRSSMFPSSGGTLAL